MSNSLIKHINHYIPLSEEEIREIQPYFTSTTLKKKDILLNIGEKCDHNYFIVQGCLHMFFIDEKGTERTVQFAIENWWLTDNLSFIRQEPSNFTIQAVSDAEVLSISFHQQEEMLTRFPQLEKYFRIIYQIAHGANSMRLKFTYGFSKEERYFHFVESLPEFANRVPQYLIASFLGLTPEYVSEIRAKKRS